MKPEPLIGKEVSFDSWILQKNGKVWFDKEDVKSACEFYLKYKDNPLLLIKDFPSYEKYVFNFVKNYTELKDKTLIEFDFKKYNEWLFKLSFKPVFEEDDGGD